jgi:hypothetical protein
VGVRSKVVVARGNTGLQRSGCRLGFKFTTEVVIGNDCTGSCKFNYHTMNGNCFIDIDKRLFL